MKKTTLLLVLWFFVQNISAQEKPGIFAFGLVEKIHSSALNEDRTLNIYLPDGYAKDSTAKFPVVYVLDGSANEDFPHIAGLAQFMMMYGLIPPSIIVGIANVDRYRDFTSPSADTADRHKLPTSGGSAAFITFLKKEVQPYLEKRFRTGAQKTIIGQSLGGLLATEILFEQPQLFDQYIIVSPSLWWNKFDLLKQAGKKLGQKQENKKVYIAVGNEPEEMTKGASELEQVLKKHLGNKIQVTREYFPLETHATILHRAVYAALEWLYPKK